MSYNKTNWGVGTVITATRMNNIENQIDAISPKADGAIRYDTSQSSLTSEQKDVARANIGAISNTELTNSQKVVAPLFDSTQAYSVEDLVIYDNKLYRFKVNHAAGAWNNEHVEEIDIAEALENKADINGYYESLGVGTADQLAATQYEEDKVPYTYRTSGGSADIGNRVDEEIVGGTICWNQKSSNGKLSRSNQDWTTVTLEGLTFTKNSDNSVSINGTQTSRSYVYDNSNAGKDMPCNFNDVILITATGTATLPLEISLSFYNGTDFLNGATLYFDQKNGIISKAPAGTTTLTAVAIISPAGNNNKTISAKIYTNCFNLTQMFGIQVADYIYNLEQANTGAGVAFFRKLFPKPYYEYNAGELISVSAARKETTGFNLWDEEWENGTWNASGQKVADAAAIRSANYIPVFPNTNYYITYPTQGLVVRELDNNKNCIKTDTLYSANRTGASLTTDSNCNYLVFCTYTSDNVKVYNNDICLNLSWSGYRDGEYESYKKFTTDFDTELELRGIVKLDADNNLYYDGDTYESDGTVTRKYGIVDLGTLTWSVSGGGSNYFDSQNNAVPAKSSTGANTFCSLYNPHINSNVYGDSADKYIVIDGNKKIIIKDTAYSTAVAFKTAMSGVYLIYELATPTTEIAAPFTKTQWVDDFGTEQFIDAKVLAGSRDVSMPVGHESKYLANLRDRLQHLPEPAEEDGDYYIRQKNEQMELVNFADGYNHPNGVVGTAQQLESTIYEEDKVPYSFRTSGGSADIGNRVDEEIVGGTVAWNQRVNTLSSSKTRDGITFTNNNDGSVTLNGTATADIGTVSSGLAISTSVTMPRNNHVVLTMVKNEELPSGLCYGIQGYAISKTKPFFHKEAQTSDWTAGYFSICITNGTTLNNIVLKPQMFDLTQMFGATVANYVYTLEQATAGAGVIWFKSLFPKDYYAYNPGELMSVNVARKETIGFNLLNDSLRLGCCWDRNGNYLTNLDNHYAGTNIIIPCLPNTTYTFSCPDITATSFLYCALFDGNKKFLQLNDYISFNQTTYYTTYTTNANTHFISFYIYRATDMTADEVKHVSFSLTWSGARDGEYESYEKQSHEFGDVELRGIPKLDANNKLYYDGDTYESNGTVTRKYGVADLGTINWTTGVTYNSTDIRFIGTISDIKPAKATSEIPTNLYCSKYSATSPNYTYTRTRGIAIETTASGAISIYDADYAQNTTAAQFKTAMSGVYLVYELATPTIETASPFANPSHVDDWGTEEFIDRAVEAGDRDVSVPVGHNSKYMANLRDKLQHLPDLAANNGTYVINQSNNAMALISIENMIDNTLTEAGKAADAKKTGDELADLKTALKTDIGNVGSLIIDRALENPSIVVGKYAQTETGIIDDSASYDYAEYSDVSSYMSLHVVTQMGSRAGICFYDANGDYVSSIANETGSVDYDADISVPDNAKMMRVSCVKTYIDNLSVGTTLKETSNGLKDQIIIRTKQADFTKLQGNFESLYSGKLLEISTEWEQGSLNANTGAEVSTYKYIRTKAINRKDFSGVVLLPDSGWIVMLYCYASDDSIVTPTTYKDVGIASQTQIIFGADVSYFRLDLHKSDSSVIDTGSSEHLDFRMIPVTQDLSDISMIPSYYFENNYLQNKIARINELYNKYAADGTAFVFITDEHFEHPRCNAQISPMLLNYINKNTNIRVLVDGGDNADGASELWCNLLRKNWNGRIYHAIGNHDYMYSTSEKEQYLYAMCDSYNTDQIGVNNRHYYYVDNPQEKIRYVVLSSYAPSGSASSAMAEQGYEADQVTWLSTIALNVPTGWGIIVFTHGMYEFNPGDSGMGEYYYISDRTNGQAILDVLEAYSGNGEIISIIFGHAHLDRVIYTPVANLCGILTNCDGNTVTRFVTEDPRITGTTGEQCLDIFILDRPNHTWHVVRIGTPAYDGIGTDPGDAVEERTIDYSPNNTYDTLSVYRYTL